VKEKNKGRLTNIGSENPSTKSKLEIEDQVHTEGWMSYGSRPDQGGPIGYFQSKSFQEVYVDELRI